MKIAVQILSESPVYWAFPLAQRLALVKQWHQERDVAAFRARVIDWLRTGRLPVFQTQTVGSR
jgi:hypothetical protein